MRGCGSWWARVWAKTQPEPGGGLEAAGAPAAIHEEALDRGAGDDGAGVGADVHGAGPLPQHADAAEDGEQLADSSQGVLNDAEVAVEVVAHGGVDAGAEDEFAAVSLMDVHVDGGGHDDGVEDGLEGFRDEGLEGM